MHGFGGSIGFGVGFGWLFWLVILGVIIWAVITLVNRSVGSNETGTSRSGERAEDILKKRYARGEISREEYREMQADLQ